MKGLLAVLLLAAPLGAFADDFTGRTGVGGAVGAAVPLGTTWLRDNASADLGLGAWIRRGFSERWSAGFSYDNLMMERVRIQPIMLDAFYNLLPESRFNPNLHAGLGLSHVRGVDPLNNNDTFGLKAGLGAEVLLWKGLSLGGAVDYHLAARNQRTSREVHALFAGLTLGWWFDACAAEPARAAAPPPAPAPAPVAAVPPPPPAPADADKDGVPDDKDRCPGSPAGTPVNSMGCPKSEKVRIALAVEFDTAKAVVKPEYDDQLRKVADFMKTYPDTKAEIEGHTDNVGDAAYNKDLSQRRAAAVRQALIERFGVDGGRLSAAGYGPERPIADNGSLEGRAKNRRVVATFTAIKD